MDSVVQIQFYDNDLKEDGEAVYIGSYYSNVIPRIGEKLTYVSKEYVTVGYVRRVENYFSNYKNVSTLGGELHIEQNVYIFIEVIEKVSRN